MAIKKYKPTTNGRRGMSTLVSNEITASTPEKSLIVTKSKTGGRNNQGRMTVRHIGGGAKQKYRVIDFKRNKIGVTGRIATIEYDPNRNANIALVNYRDGEKRYIIAPKDITVGTIIESGPQADIKVGNALPLANIPVGTVIHNKTNFERRFFSPHQATRQKKKGMSWNWLTGYQTQAHVSEKLKELSGQVHQPYKI